MICLCSKYVKNCNIFGQILNIWVKLILKKNSKLCLRTLKVLVLKICTVLFRLVSTTDVGDCETLQYKKIKSMLEIGLRDSLLYYLLCGTQNPFSLCVLTTISINLHCRSECPQPQAVTMQKLLFLYIIVWVLRDKNSCSKHFFHWFCYAKNFNTVLQRQSQVIQL